jgi:hypothetical protein
MAVKDLTSSEVAALANTRHALSGVKFLAQGESDYHNMFMNALHLLSRESAAWGMVHDDDAAGTTVRVMPCRALLDGVTLIYAGGTISLAAYNNDVAYVWLEDDGAGAAQISADSDANGWPSTPHFKLAEVTLVSGAVTSGGILDRSQEHKLGLAGIDVVRYDMAISVQGDTGSPSTIVITQQDVGGNAIAEVAYLRVRVCDSGAYADATNATIAAGANTTAVETISATKDLILKSHTDGTWTITLTDGTAETVTLRTGPAPIGGRRGDHANSLNVTHAAP